MKRFLPVLLLWCVPQFVAAQTPAPSQVLRPSPPEMALPGDAALMQTCTGLFSMEKTYALARKWIDAWNSQSTDRVMALYTPDFEFRAQGILTNANISNPSGVLHGQADNRLRWFGKAGSKEKSSQQFRLVGAYSGVRSIAVHYVNRMGRLVVEVSEYAPDCKIERSNALYGINSDGRPVANGE
jgi:hypothetical protein